MKDRRGEGVPPNFVSVADKGVSVFVSSLESTLTGGFVSVADKGLKFTVGLGFGLRLGCRTERLQESCVGQGA